ncbi:MAG: hypothetical protein ABUK19_03965 [Desulfobacteria bacterium]
MATHPRIGIIERFYQDPRSWTIVLIGDLGKIVSLHLTKPLLLASTACLALIFAVFIYSAVSYRSVRSENKALSKDLDRLSAKLRSAEETREEALVRLMLVEERAGQAAGKTVNDAEQQTKDKASQATDQTPPATAGAKARAQEKPRPTLSSTAETDKVAPPTPAARVSVRNLEIWLEPNNNEFKFKFKVQNTDRQRGKVAGYAFLVLKPKGDSGRPPRVFPVTPLKNGKPNNFKNGHHFSIARYTFVRGTLAEVSTIAPFETAKIYVYSDTGDFLLEEVFNVGGVIRS